MAASAEGPDGARKQAQPPWELMATVAAVGFAMLMLAALAGRALAGWQPAAPHWATTGGRQAAHALDLFEHAVEDGDLQAVAASLADDVAVTMYNYAVDKRREFVGSDGALELLRYAAAAGCKRGHETAVLREVDESSRTAYIAWKYHGVEGSNCGPSSEMIVFDAEYKIRRIHAMVDWRLVRPNATLEAFKRLKSAFDGTDISAATQAFAEDAIIDFHNVDTGLTEYWRRGSDALGTFLGRMWSKGCAMQPRAVTTLEVDENERTAYVAWGYSGWVANFCGPGAQLFYFDGDYKVARAHTWVDWRQPVKNATSKAFTHFENLLHVWRSKPEEAVAVMKLFSEDSAATFWNEGTKEQRFFKGPMGAKDLLDYAASLSCALLPDSVRLDHVDEVARTVYITWDYPFEKRKDDPCHGSGEMYQFDRDYKIFRLNAFVNWKG